MAILGVDVGAKRVGLAVADENLRLPLPIGIADRGSAESDILKLVTDRQISTIVFGLPLNEDDTEGPACQAVRKFAKRISKRASVKIVFVDEYGSSTEAHEILGQAPGTRVDHAAAVLILERFFRSK